MIQVFHVSKYYDSRPALSDVNLQIDKGEFVLLSGPSGAGKTTLLKLLFCAERPDAGHVLIQGRNTSRIRSSEVPYLRRTIGVVFQDFRLLPKKSVFENVALPLVVQGASTFDIRLKVMEALKAVGAEHKMDAHPITLSAGEQQRVCIARAIVNAPMILLADEPTGNLDSQLAHEINELFKAINARGTTVMVATHNRQVMEQGHCRVVSLDQGMLVTNEESHQ